jgi:ankyrin repeat protein
MSSASDAQTLEALLDAAMNEDLATLSAILDRHPELVNAVAPNGRRALAVSISGYFHDGVALLRARGAEPTVFEAAALGDRAALDAWLRTDPALVHAYNSDGFTALHLAAYYGQVEAARALLAASADPNAGQQSDAGNTPLQVASGIQGNDQVGELLLVAGADVNARMEYVGTTPLHQAVKNTDMPLVRVLLAHGADRAARDVHGQTPWDIARDIAEVDPDTALVPLLEG